MMRLLRYTLVGAVATAVHYLLLVLCVEAFEWRAWLASGVGAVVGAQLAYYGNRRFTFAYRGGYSTSWVRFQLTAMAGAVQGMAVVAGAIALGWHYLAAQVLATITGLLLTFAINRAWTFR